MTWWMITMDQSVSSRCPLASTMPSTNGDGDDGDGQRRETEISGLANLSRVHAGPFHDRPSGALRRSSSH